MNRCSRLLMAVMLGLLACKDQGGIAARDRNLAALLATIPPQRLLRFLHISDTHLRTDADPYGRQTDLPRYANWFTKVKYMGADFVVNTGDVCDDQPAILTQVAQINAASGMRVILVAGNHDDADGNSPQDYYNAIGPLYYSFKFKGFHIVNHWSQRPQLTWLAQDLNALGYGTPVIFFQHFNVYLETYTVLERYNIILAVDGHTHSRGDRMSGRIREVTAAAFYLPEQPFNCIDIMSNGTITVLPLRTDRISASDRVDTCLDPRLQLE